MTPKIGWLTINRNCNFRCKWCYAESTGFDNKKTMDLQLAYKLVDLLSDIGVNFIVIIGGEPTVHPHLLDIMSYINSKKIEFCIVTNGYKLSSKEYISDLESTGLRKITFSLKGWDQESYKKFTGVDAYEKIKKAISNLNDYKSLSVTYSQVLTKDNVNEIEAAARLVPKINEKENCGLSLSFCSPVFDSDRNPLKGSVCDYDTVIKSFSEKYKSINEITEGRFRLEQTLPHCLWPEGFIDKLKSNNHIVSGCHVFSRSGVVFDTDGSVLLCNCLCEFPIGKYETEFSNKDEFNQFWRSEEVKNIQDQMICYPDNKCEACDIYQECGGGCPIQWFVFDPKKVLETKL